MAIAPKNFAGVSNAASIAIAIAVGDAVIVHLCNGDNSTPTGLHDDGASGGNSYVQLQPLNVQSAGQSGIWYCFCATVAATTVSYTGGHTPNICVGTYTGVGCIGISSNFSSNGGYTSPLGGLVTTPANIVNSYIVGMYTGYWTGGNVTFSANTGTLRINLPSSVGVYTGMVWVDLPSPLASTTYSPKVDVSHTTGLYANIMQIVLLPPAPGTPVTPVLVDSVLPDATIGVAYSQTITASGGTPSYTFAVNSGSLPTSLSLNTSTGVISGTPTVAGTYSFTIGVTDSLGNTGSQAFSITVSAAVAGGGSFTFLA